MEDCNHPCRASFLIVTLHGLYYESRHWGQWEFPAFDQFHIFLILVQLHDIIIMFGHFEQDNF